MHAQCTPYTTDSTTSRGIAGAHLHLGVRQLDVVEGQALFATTRASSLAGSPRPTQHSLAPHYTTVPHPCMHSKLYYRRGTWKARAREDVALTLRRNTVHHHLHYHEERYVRAGRQPPPRSLST
ncbi:hypothetical protein B0H12DRAFT_1232647 [Mycena haematopus]|nr:hypothetical protein B0H12DRAFT_1232647 [Mycena haematopus]